MVLVSWCLTTPTLDALRISVKANIAVQRCDHREASVTDAEMGCLAEWGTFWFWQSAAVRADERVGSQFGRNFSTSAGFWKNLSHHRAAITPPDKWPILCRMAHRFSLYLRAVVATGSGNRWCQLFRTAWPNRLILLNGCPVPEDFGQTGELWHFSVAVSVQYPLARINETAALIRAFPR
jgi:hypothetical protein